MEKEHVCAQCERTDKLFSLLSIGISEREVGSALQIEWDEFSVAKQNVSMISQCDCLHTHNLITRIKRTIKLLLKRKQHRFCLLSCYLFKIPIIISIFEQG